MSIGFKVVKRKLQFSFVTPVTEKDIEEYNKTGSIKAKGSDIYKVSINFRDVLDNLSPKIGDMIAINPKNHFDQWLIEEKYFKDNHVIDIEQYGIKPIIIDLKWQK